LHGITHIVNVDWVSEFAPPNHQKLLSYFTGWMSVMSWQAGAASGPFLVGTMIQSLVFVNKESYEATNWQGTLMVWGITFIVYLGNVYGGRAMPVFQNVMLIVHVFAFLAVSDFDGPKHFFFTNAMC
jgi:MFS family permease